MKKPARKSKYESELELKIQGLENKIELLLERVILLQRKVDQGPDPRLFGDERGTRY